LKTASTTFQDTLGCLHKLKIYQTVCCSTIH